MLGRTTRLTVKVAALTVAMLASQLVAVALAPAATRLDLQDAAGLPPQGLYEYCQLGTGPGSLARCEARLAVMSNAGFATVVNYGDLFGSMANLLAYGRYAQSLGLTMVWDLDDPSFWGTDGLGGTAALALYPQMAASCRAGSAACATNAELAQWVVGQLKTQPETWMYLIGDEPNLWQADHPDPAAPQQLQAWGNLIHAADPSHATFVVSNEGGSGLPCGNGSAILPFIGTAGVVGGDYYPVYPARPCPVSGWDTIASAQQGYVSQFHKSGLVLSVQAFGDGEPDVGLTGPFPTARQMRQERDDILANSSPTAILWYSFFYQSGGAPPRPAWQWNAIRAAAFAPSP
ncbi:MAG TPA: hypothetical protein VGS19_01520 [Streptosporangiaceae bacterium]|nr:hypothetical protein [Streptosporangiaceae bacterium]